MSDHAREILQTRYRLDRWAGAVGLQIEAVSDDRLRLRLPYSEDNMNLGGRLHGGVIATALVDAGKLLARWLASDASVEITPLDFQIFYLRAGGRHPVTAEVRLLRRTRTVLFLEGHAAHEDGRTLATAALSLRTFDAALRGRDEDHTDLAAAMRLVPGRQALEHPLGELFNQRFQRAGRPVRIGHLEQGLGYIDQEPEARIEDDTGTVAPGYLLLLFDRMGSVVSGTWARERVMSVTVSMQLSFCGPATRAPLRVIGRTQRHYGELSHNRVEIYARESGRLLLSGQVTHLLRPQRRAGG
ncbi:MAG TPA: hotdog fold thioesterase [Gammaproteobacteria bacterium]|nr:hotdog fold thioesterase [Gammaproteobacteria bacterium]